MELIVCTDERGGMAFNKRRVSKDTEIMNRVEQIAKGNDIYISPRSESLFKISFSVFSIVCLGIFLSESPALKIRVRLSIKFLTLYYDAGA